MIESLAQLVWEPYVDGQEALLKKSVHILLLVTMPNSYLLVLCASRADPTLELRF